MSWLTSLAATVALVVGLNYTIPAFMPTFCNPNGSCHLREQERQGIPTPKKFDHNGKEIKTSNLSALVIGDLVIDPDNISYIQSLRDHTYKIYWKRGESSYLRITQIQYDTLKQYLQNQTQFKDSIWYKGKHLVDPKDPNCCNPIPHRQCWLYPTPNSPDGRGAGPKPPHAHYPEKLGS